ncbi:MAG: hypothetical protein U5K00_22845 [Melioribacteraceae bacterium]|nr:hypothetical protein [Melioribacteraceae bacterium]
MFSPKMHRYEDFYDIDATVIIFDLPALNNGGDKAILMDGNSFIIDSLTYSSLWGER